MKHSIRIILTAAVIIFGAMDAMAIEESIFNIFKKDNNFEIRDYSPNILAETVMEGDLEEAGNRALKRLFRYISGDNRSHDKVAMTAPVYQEPVGEKIQMTDPVGQRSVQDRWAVSFMMPGSYTLETLPEPWDPKVTFVRFPLAGWPQYATPVSGVRKTIFDTNRHWSLGFTKGALP